MDEDETLMAAIERASLWAWPPERTRAVAGWLLRAGATASRRQNSVQALTFTGEMPPERAIEAVEAWYAGEGRPACFQLNPLSRPEGLDGLLAVRDYRVEAATGVWTRPLDVTEQPSVDVELEGRATAGVMQAVCDVRWTAVERSARAALFARIRRPLAFAVKRVGGEPVAGGLCVVDGPLAGIAAMRTAAQARGAGHARAVLRRLLAWAAAMGAETAWLQVQDDNEPARRLYASAGFRPLYPYHYRVG